MEGIYERYINYGEFKELVEGKDGWVRDLMMSIGLGDIRKRVKPSKNVSYWPIINQETSLMVCEPSCAQYFPADTEESFLDSNYKVFNYFKTIGDYNLICDFRSMVVSFRAHISDYGRMRRFISEIDAYIYDLLKQKQCSDDELLVELPQKKIDDYPIVSDDQLSYLSNHITEGCGRRRVLNDSIKRKLYGRIYDITEDWEIKDRNTPRMWRILLEVLCRSGVVKSNETTKYRDYARYIVKYCIGDAQDIRKRIAKCSLDESYTNWSNKDKTLYGKIKKDIFPTL